MATILLVKVVQGKEVFDCFVQQVTEKIVTLIVSDIETMYMRRDTGLAYSKKDVDKGWCIPLACLQKIEAFMANLGKPKWHSGWMPMKNGKPASDLDKFQVINLSVDCSDAELLEMMSQTTFEKKSEKRERQKFISKSPVSDELFDDFSKDDVKVEKPKRFKDEVEADLSSDEFDDEFEDIGDPIDEFSPQKSYDFDSPRPGKSIDELF